LASDLFDFQIIANSLHVDSDLAGERNADQGRVVAVR